MGWLERKASCGIELPSDFGVVCRNFKAADVAQSRRELPEMLDP
jgi:hypothetical protein